MTQNVNTEAEQDKTGKDQDVAKLQEQINTLLADKDKLSIEVRNLRSSAGESSKLQKQLEY